MKEVLESFSRSMNRGMGTVKGRAGNRNKFPWLYRTNDSKGGDHMVPLWKRR